MTNNAIFTVLNYCSQCKQGIEPTDIRVSMYKRKGITFHICGKCNLSRIIKKRTKK